MRAGRPVREEEGLRGALREVAQRVFGGEQLGSAMRMTAQQFSLIASIADRGARTTVHATGVGAPRSDSTVTTASPVPREVSTCSRS